MERVDLWLIEKNAERLGSGGRWLSQEKGGGPLRTASPAETNTNKSVISIVMNTVKSGGKKRKKMKYRAKLLNDDNTIIDILFDDNQLDLLDLVDKLYGNHKFGPDVRVIVQAVVSDSCNTWTAVDTICDYVLDNDRHVGV